MKFKVLAALAALAVAQPASAAIISITAKGTLTSGFDQSGMFGPANTDLGGAIFMLVSTFDTSTGHLILDPTHEQSYGGWILDGGPSPGSSALTINGVTVVEPGNGESSLVANASGFFQVYTKEVNIGDHVTTENDLFLGATLNPAVHLADSWHSDCPAADMCKGSFSFSQYNFNTVPGNPSSYLYINTGSYKVDSIDVSVDGPVSGAVPEPATWAMMIAGFGLVGATLRRRRLEIA